MQGGFRLLARFVSFSRLQCEQIGDTQGLSFDLKACRCEWPERTWVRSLSHVVSIFLNLLGNVLAFANR